MGVGEINLLIAPLKVAKPYGLAENLHLSASIIEIVFTRDAVAVSLKQVGYAVAKDAATARPIVSGPVGFALTYSTMAFLPFPDVPRPKSSLRWSTSVRESIMKGAVRKKLMNPGPATSAFSTLPEGKERCSMSSCARARGFCPALWRPEMQCWWKSARI